MLSLFRDPSPLDNYERVRLGDVGFIRGGAFHLLFNAGDHPQRYDRQNHEPSHILRDVTPINLRQKRRNVVLEKPQPIYHGVTMEAGAEVEFTVDVRYVTKYAPSSEC